MDGTPHVRAGRGTAGGASATRRRSWALSAVVAAVAIGLLWVVPGPDVALFDAGPWAPSALLAAFVLSEPLVFHLQARSETVSHSPSDVPLALGALVVAPWVLLVVRVLGSLVALRYWRRQPPFKILLNLAAFMLEGVAVAFVLRLLVGTRPAVGPALWGGLVVAMVAGLIVGGATIATAISLFEGSLARRLLDVLTQSRVFYLNGAVLGASIAVAYVLAPWFAAVLLLLFGMAWQVLRTHGSLRHRLGDLREIHAFSAHVGRSAQLQDIADAAVEQIAEHLRAATVCLHVIGPGGRSVTSHTGDPVLLEALPDALDDVGTDLPLDEPVRVVASDPGPVAEAFRAAGVSAGVVVLLGEDEALGLLVVADRIGVIGRFEDGDLERLRPLAQQLTVALRKGQLYMEVQHRALHDKLTGLPNRAYFDAWMAEHVAGSTLPSALLMVDLDRFKEVNDTLGHHAGDDLLVEVTGRLREVTTDRDMVARFGGDEFAVLAPGLGAAEASMLAAIVSDELERPIVLGDTTVAIAGSVGIALHPVHGSTPDELLRRADLAMYEAKRRHERALVFRPEFEGTDSTRLALLGDLREALGTGGIVVHHQPQRDLRSGEIVGVEALARWHHPAHGHVSPEVFVGLAEQVGLIEQLTRCVLDDALAVAATWRRDGLDLDLAVNISPQSLVSETFVDTVADALARAGVPAHRLTLEITERAMVSDSPRTRRVLEDLDAMGVRFSVDDFGTGHSSMSNLRHMPIAELKIDRSFITDMLVGDTDQAIVDSVIALGHNLGMSVVAEGVETVETERRLRAAGCDVAQGYGIARPLTAERLTNLLERVPVRRLGDAPPAAATRPRRRSLGAQTTH